MDQALLLSIVQRLQRFRQATTYGALAGVLGETAETVVKSEPRIPRNSWIVNETTREPTGYASGEIHPELFSSIATNGVIETPHQLLDWLSLHEEDAPRDEWERRLFTIGTDCGTSPPPSAWTSEEMYD